MTHSLSRVLGSAQVVMNGGRCPSSNNHNVYKKANNVGLWICVIEACTRRIRGVRCPVKGIIW